MTTFHKKLTDKLISSKEIIPTVSGQQDEYYDLSFPGLALRVGISGKKVFTLLYRFNKKSKRYTIGRYPAKSLKAARKLAGELQQRVEKGEDIATLKRGVSNLAFEELGKLFIEKYSKPNKKTWTEDQQKLDKKFSVWNDLEADSITCDDVLDRIEYIKENHGPIAANRNAALIKKLFKWAKEKRLITNNSATDIPKEKENSRDRILSDTEIPLFWQACTKKNYPFGYCFQLMLLTGRREGSVSQMEWPDINFTTKEWHVRSEIDKTGKPAVVPLPDMAIEILQTIYDNYRFKGCDYVFTTTQKTTISGFSRAKADLDKLCKVNGWVLQDLRRTCRTNLPRLGVDPFISKLVIGHKIQGIDAVYDRYSYQPEKREALDKWAEFLQGLLDGDGSKVVQLHS